MNPDAPDRGVGDTVRFVVEDIVPATREQVFDAWLTSEGHTAMTGAPAEANAAVGGTFIAWDGYISGANLEVERPSHIVQAWRTSEFEQDEPDSLVRIELFAHADGTRVVITHENLPPHGTQYEQGWQDHYYSPMKAHFGA